MTAEPARQLFTWADYRTWSDGQRWEIVDGGAFAMSPAPTVRHQAVVSRLDHLLRVHFDGKRCQVFPSPIDVKLSDRDVVQPDLIVVCEPDQLRSTHIEGAPTLVIEVLSPSTEAFDRGRKMRLYARSRVPEVWLITPYPWLAEVYVLEGDGFRLERVYEKDETLSCHVFPELKIDLARVFDFPLAPGEEIAMVKEGRPPYGSG